MRIARIPPTTISGPRRRPRRRLSFLLLLVPLLSGLVGAPAGVANSDDLAAAKARQEQLEAQIAEQNRQVAELEALQGELEQDIDQTNTALRGINADLEEMQRSIARMVDRIETIKLRYARLVREVEALDAQLIELEAKEAAKAEELRERKLLLADRMRAAYETDRVSLLETFLSGGSFSDVLSEVGYYLDIGEQDKELADQIARDQETLAALTANVELARTETNLLRQKTAVQKKELDRELRGLKTAQAQLKELEDATEEALEEQRATFARMSANKEQLELSIRKGAAAQKELGARIKQLIREEAERGAIPSEYSGTFEWPMEGVVTQRFGCTGFSWEAPLGDCPAFHRGIDIAAPMYREITAAGDGTVVFAGPNPYDAAPQAWIVIIAHAGNLNTWYAHIDDTGKPPAVMAGDVVKAGDVIAYNGSTGRSTGPHLHWAVEYNRQFVNPRLFL